MPSRVIARKPARLIPIFPGEEPYFNPRGEIPVNSENSARVRAGIYRAELIDIVPVVNRTPEGIGGLPHQSVYAWA